MALPSQLTDAATALVHQCVVNGLGIGGMVTDVGKYVCEILGFC